MPKSPDDYEASATDIDMVVEEVTGKPHCRPLEYVNVFAVQSSVKRTFNLITLVFLGGLATLGLSLPLLPLSAPSQIIQWTTNSGGNGHYYEAVSATNGIAWASAQALAVGKGGYLATITSAAENNFVYGLISGNLSYWRVTGSESWGPWLGGLQPAGSAETAGGWTWTTGEAFSYQNWAALQPNNNANENRIQFHGHNAPGGASTWNDLNDANVQYVGGYLIEYTALPALSIALGDGQVRVTWQTNSAGFTLQCTTNLVLPTVWSTVSPAPVVSNGQNVVTNPISGTMKYYRLSQ